jgi:HAMP domain-containing protein
MAAMSATALLGGIVGLIVAYLFIRMAEVERRLNRLSRLESKVDALMTHAGITFDEFHDVPADVREALERGQTIEATGMGLREAKQLVDDVRQRTTTTR